MKKLLLILLFVSVSFKAVYAQGHVFRNYNTNHELPSSETYCVVKDQKGYMWFATDRGVAKFDGYGFKVFSSANGLPDNTVFELFVDNDKVWFKTVSSEIGYFKNDSVYSYQFKHLMGSVSPPKMLRYMLVAPNGHIIFSRDEVPKVKIFEIDSTGKIDSSKNTASDEIKRIYINKKGEEVVSGNLHAKKISIFLYETNTLIGLYQTPTASSTVFASPSKKGDGFFLFVNHHIILIHNNKCTKIAECNTGEVLSLFSDNDDNIWVGYRYQGFERLAKKNGYRKDFTALSHLSVSSINQDNEGGLWFTTLENAIYYLPPPQLLSYTEEQGLPISKTIKIEKINDDIIAILSDYSVLKKGKNDKHFKILQSKLPLPVDIAAGTQGRVYVICYYKKLNGFTQKEHIYLDALKNIHVGHKYIWGLNFQVINKYDTQGKNLEQIQLEGVSRAITLYEQKNGDLLIGTLNGLYLYKNGFLHALKERSPLLGYRISDISAFNNDVLIATIGKGILIIKDGDFSNPRQYTTTDGLPSMICNVMRAGTDSCVWVGTNRGLCRMKFESNSPRATFLKIDINDGIASNEINNLFIDGNDLWVATSKGITVVPMNTVTDKLPDIPMFIEGLSVNGESVSISNSQTFTYTQNNISVFFSGLHYRHAGKLQYKYRMNGDTNWYYTSNRSVVFNGLQPGNYTFEVGVIKPGGQLNPLWAKYSFVILPPFWKTWWFVALAAVIIIGLLSFIIYRLALLKKDELYRKASLDRKLAQLELEAIKAQINPHFIYNCLNSIQYFNYKSDYISVKKYFGMLARLIRQTMQFSHETFVTLEAEINYLTNYLELEKIRFKEKLNYTLTVDEGLGSNTLLPSMLIQPYIENALKHGIANLESNGQVWVNFSEAPAGGTLVVIEDNGPGFKETASNIDDVHFGMRLTKGRVTSYNQLFGLNIGVKVVEKQSENPFMRGLKIELYIPVISNFTMGAM